MPSVSQLVHFWDSLSAFEDQGNTRDATSDHSETTKESHGQDILHSLISSKPLEEFLSKRRVSIFFFPSIILVNHLILVLVPAFNETFFLSFRAVSPYSIYSSVATVLSGMVYLSS